ncbi:MAG: hypothetical protein BWX68_03052 [Verrucomicrobia bacterium ADurb.Bin063]|nr:MAG: hypothetical protein BWX68_03052 [Verrucomicrobia bacterium ADurb.Bin063]
MRPDTSPTASGMELAGARTVAIARPSSPVVSQPEETSTPSIASAFTSASGSGERLASAHETWVIGLVAMQGTWE